MESVLASRLPGLDSLPADIIYIILGYLDTAQSLAHLAATCRGLRRIISHRGWRIFVTTCFSSLKLPAISADDNWAELARTLTAQSRDWDRRAFIVSSLSPPQRPQRSNVRRGQGIQTIPSSIVVDAHLQRRGRFDEELVVWGAGEDVFARMRRNDRWGMRFETWRCWQGSETGFMAGKDDVMAVSIAKGRSPGGNESLGVVVGRANGDLRLLSTRESNFGHTLMQFRPSPESPLLQREIRAIDIERDSAVMAAGTKDAVLLYSVQGRSQTQDNITNSSYIDPLTAVSLRDAPQSSSFDYIRSVRLLNKETIAVALNRSYDPIHVLHVTPTGFDVSKPARVSRDNLNTGSDLRNLRTVRTLLPVDTRSIVGGTGNTLLSSWDDGTIRLQDLRTPSAIDRTYQDNFDVGTPINALVSYGLERFVAGSAYTHILKVFDYRWPKGYYHTDALPCTSRSPYPTPTPPTIVDEPQYHGGQLPCDHVLGRLCRWHSLSRHDFYRPNCNIFLPFKSFEVTPVCSMAKPSDVSPTLYVGVMKTLVEFTLKSGMANPPVSSTRPLYVRRKGKVAIIETGDGSEIRDFSTCQRMPEIRRQSFGNNGQGTPTAGRHDRLDETLQIP